MCVAVHKEKRENGPFYLINVVCERYVTFMVVHLLFLLISNGAGCSAPTCFLNFFVLREPTLIDPLSIFLKHLAGSP
jgi:hypothetical protein